MTFRIHICIYFLYKKNLKIPIIYTTQKTKDRAKTTQRVKEKVHKAKQRSTKHTHKTKDRVTQTPLKTGGELNCFGG
jgi:hypothetical protein